VETLLGQRCDEVLSLIETGRKELVTSALDIHGQRMRKLREAETSLASRLCDLQSSLVFGQVLSKNGNDAEVGCMLQQFQLKADQVTSQQSHELPEHLDLQLTFDVAQHTADILSKTSVVFGSIATAEAVSTEDATASRTQLTEAAEAKPQQSIMKDTVHSADVDYKRQQHSVPKSLRLIGKITGTKSVRGIAIIGNRLFVVHGSVSTVDIKRADSLASVGKFDVNGLVDATDMAACSTTKRIYISSKIHSSVFSVKLQLSDVEMDIDVGLHKLKRQPCGISVAPNFNVLVAHPKSECFAEFTADMYQVRVVETPGLRSYKVVFLTDNRSVICGGDWSNSVSIWSVDGEKSAAGDAVAECTHQMDTFKRPTHIAVDANCNVIVVDSHRHRIVITNSELFKPLFTFHDEYTNGLDKFCLSTNASKLYVGNCIKRGVTVVQ